jgi:hypothetical protein
MTPDKIYEISGVKVNLAVIFMVNIVTVIMMFMLIFVSWKKGSKCWQKIAPKMYIVMVWTCYLGIPFGIISLSLYFFIKQRDVAH